MTGGKAEAIEARFGLPLPAIGSAGPQRGNLEILCARDAHRPPLLPRPLRQARAIGKGDREHRGQAAAGQGRKPVRPQ